MKKVDISETNADCDLKLIDLMKISYSIHNFLTLAQGHLHMKFKLAFLSNHFQPNFECKLVDARK